MTKLNIFIAITENGNLLKAESYLKYSVFSSGIFVLSSKQFALCRPRVVKQQEVDLQLEKSGLECRQFSFSCFSLSNTFPLPKLREQLCPSWRILEPRCSEGTLIGSAERKGLSLHESLSSSIFFSFQPP